LNFIERYYPEILAVVGGVFFLASALANLIRAVLRA
jgi:hypothetical protein